MAPKKKVKQVFTVTAGRGRQRGLHRHSSVRWVGMKFHLAIFLILSAGYGCSDSGNNSNDLREDIDGSLESAPSWHKTPPTLKGLRLGMTKAEAEGVLLGLAKKCRNLDDPSSRAKLRKGVDRYVVFFERITRDAEMIECSFYNGLLSEVTFHKDWRGAVGPYEIPDDMTTREFAQGLSKSLGLPTFNWKPSKTNMEGDLPFFHLVTPPPADGWEIQVVPIFRDYGAVYKPDNRMDRLKLRNVKWENKPEANFGD